MIQVVGNGICNILITISYLQIERRDGSLIFAVKKAALSQNAGAYHGNSQRAGEIL